LLKGGVLNPPNTEKVRGCSRYEVAAAAGKRDGLRYTGLCLCYRQTAGKLNARPPSIGVEMWIRRLIVRKSGRG